MAEPVYHLGKQEMKATLFLDDRSIGELKHRFTGIVFCT